MSKETKGFTYGEYKGEYKIEGFSCKCEKCGSGNVSVEYEFNYYGGMTGYDTRLSIDCQDCDNAAVLFI
jgi:hypothetical protein